MLSTTCDNLLTTERLRQLDQPRASDYHLGLWTSQYGTCQPVPEVSHGGSNSYISALTQLFLSFSVFVTWGPTMAMIALKAPDIEVVVVDINEARSQHGTTTHCLNMNLVSKKCSNRPSDGTFSQHGGKKPRRKSTHRFCQVVAVPNCSNSLCEDLLPLHENVL